MNRIGGEDAGLLASVQTLAPCHSSDCVGATAKLAILDGFVAFSANAKNMRRVNKLIREGDPINGLKAPTDSLFR